MASTETMCIDTSPTGPLISAEPLRVCRDFARAGTDREIWQSEGHASGKFSSQPTAAVRAAESS